MMPKFKLFIIVCAALSIVFLMFCKSPTNDDTSGEWQTVFFDDFNRSDGSIGSNYTVQIESGSGVLSISNNMLQLSGGVYYAIRCVNEVTNAVIRVSVKCSTTVATAGGNSYGFAVGAKSSILAAGQEGYAGAVFMDTDSIGIIKMSGTVLPTTLISEAYDVQENRFYLLELTINKKTLTFILTDLTTGSSETLTVIDIGSTLTGGTVSINGIQDDGDMIYFDDFKIEKYE